MFAADEFFYGWIRNEHTRAAYPVAVRWFLEWAEARGLELMRIAPQGQRPVSGLATKK